MNSQTLITHTGKLEYKLSRCAVAEGVTPAERSHIPGATGAMTSVKSATGEKRNKGIIERGRK